MNKKILRKLTLSAVTLGVAALSVTTSTFAWFTTNGNAGASTVSGTVTSSDSNMLIKTIEYWKDDSKLVAGENGASSYSSSVTKDEWSGFSNSVTLKAQDGVSLQPVTWSTESSATKFHKAGGTEHKFETDAADTDVLHYQVVFAITDLDSTGATTKKVTAKFSDFKGGEGNQYLLVNAYNGSVSDPAEAGKTISVSLLDVLSLRVESKLLTSSDLGDNNIYGITSSTNIVTDSGNEGRFTGTTKANYRYKEDINSLSDGSSGTLTGNAIDYYNNVYGLGSSDKKLTKPGNTAQGYAESSETCFSNESGIDLFSVKGTTNQTTAYVLTDFYFYIDGWDNQCFNCVGGLSLTGGKIDFTLA